jgi:hypothetical protein
MIARRYRDVAIALADDLGGQDKLSEQSKILVRQSAALTVQRAFNRRSLPVRMSTSSSSPASRMR